MDNILIVTIKDWNIKNYFELKEKLVNEYIFHIIENKEELTLENIKRINPKYIFFPHWSWIIPEEIYLNYECVLFHMTDLPYGRGGSPLQNLIMNKKYNTKISAIQVSKILDGGDIYLKEDFDISKGNAGEIYKNISKIIFTKLIPTILKGNLEKKKQVGKIVTFKRRTPVESNLKLLNNITLDSLYDFIRMLDADGYPRAYFEISDLKIELKDIVFNGKTYEGKFEVKNNE